MKKREVSTQNLHIVKNVNESSNFFGVFDLFINSPTKLPSVKTYMIVSYQKVGKRLKQSLELFILTRLFLFAEYYM